MKIKFVKGLYSLEQKCYLLGQRCLSTGKKSLLSDQRGFGMNELLGIAAALIIAAFIVIPGLRSFSKDVMDGLADWWDTTIVTKIFLTT